MRSGETLGSDPFLQLDARGPGAEQVDPVVSVNCRTSCADRSPKAAPSNHLLAYGHGVDNRSHKDPRPLYLPQSRVQPPPPLYPFGVGGGTPRPFPEWPVSSSGPRRRHPGTRRTDATAPSSSRRGNTTCATTDHSPSASYRTPRGFGGVGGTMVRSRVLWGPGGTTRDPGFF